MLRRLAEKVFWPARIPFPVMHVDTGHNFDEVLDFPDQRVGELGTPLIVASVRRHSRVTERGLTRGDDKFSEAAMEDRKREGYF